MSVTTAPALHPALPFRLCSSIAFNDFDLEGFEIGLLSVKTGDYLLLDRHELIETVSRHVPLYVNGEDDALSGFHPEEWRVVFYQIINGVRTELDTDFRVFYEDL